jgi:hypothetical protein
MDIKTWLLLFQKRITTWYFGEKEFKILTQDLKPEQRCIRGLLLKIIDQGTNNWKNQKDVGQLIPLGLQKERAK